MSDEIKLKVWGTDELSKVLGTKMKLLKGMDKVVKDYASDLSDKMKNKTDKAYTKGYATGATKASIKIIKKNGGLTAEVGPHKNYDSYVEYGTRLIEAEPVVKPVFDEVAPKFEQAVREKLENGK